MSPLKFFGETSGSDWLRPSVIALLLANLVPVFGVLCLHWEVFPLMFLFWSENVIVGVFNVLKMLCADPGQPVIWAGKLFVIPFFCVHYGMFTFVHGIFVVALFGGGLRHGRGFPTPETFWRIMQEYHLGWAVLGLAVSRAVSFATNYLGNGEYRRASLQQLMQQPYGDELNLWGNNDGSYTLYGDINQDRYNPEATSFDVTFTAVPEPSAVTITGAFLLVPVCAGTFRFMRRTFIAATI